MKKLLTFSLLYAFCCTLASGQQKISFMPSWIDQAQFAGFYLAYEKGFYAEEGLDVTIRHMKQGSSRSSLDYLEKGEVDICTSQLITSMIERGKGKKIVNVLQLAQNTGLMLVSRTPLKSFRDIEGKKVGRWKSAYFEIAEIFCNDYKINVDWITYLNDVNIFISGAVDATLCFSYHEYFNLLFAKGSIPKDHTLRFSDLGYNFPEDAVFTTDSFYLNNRDAVEKFVRATKRGWEYAAKNREEAMDTVMEYVKKNNVATNRPMQRFMLDEILNLQVNSQSGRADFKKVEERVVNMLNDALMNLDEEYRPVIYKDFIK